MSIGLPPIDGNQFCALQNDPLNFFGGSVLDVGAAPAITQMPVSIAGAGAIANRVMNYTIKGTISVTGPGGYSESITLAGGEIVTALTAPPSATPVSSMNEFQINLGYQQYTIMSGMGDGNWSSEISFRTGLSARLVEGPNFPGIVQQSGQLFLAYNNPSDPVGSPFLTTGPFLSTPYIRIDIGGSDSAALQNGPYAPNINWFDSGIDFDILGVPQTLWGIGQSVTGYAFSGTLSVIGDASAGWFGWNGTFDVNTGARL